LRRSHATLLDGAHKAMGCAALTHPTISVSALYGEGEKARGADFAVFCVRSEMYESGDSVVKKVGVVLEYGN